MVPNDNPVHRCGYRVADAHDRLGQPDHDPTADWWCPSCEEYYGDDELDIGELGRPDWVKCIAAQPGRTGTTLCGRERWSHDWTFTDVEHARATVARGDRLQPCEACMDAAGAAWSRAQGLDVGS